MASDLEYALMSATAYHAARSQFNELAPINGWGELDGYYIHDPSTGFEASVFQRGTEIVIAYTGTDELQDWLANIAAGLGANVPGQLYKAAELYARVSQENSGAQISFTGHSMGGGLASLMGVLFDRQAITFDQAPFRQAANNDTRDNLIARLTKPAPDGLGYALDAPIIQALQGFSAEIGDRPLMRENNVQDHSVVGEVLSLAGLPTYRIGNSTPIDHGVPGYDLVNLHSVSLLIALQDTPFKQASKDNPALIPMLFDGTLFKHDANLPVRNLLDHLLRNQYGMPDSGIAANGMLTRFVSDVTRITTATGADADTSLNKALVSLAMEYHYNQVNGAGGELFEVAGDGLKLEWNRISASTAELVSLPLLDDYVWNSGTFTESEQVNFSTAVADYGAWIITAGNGGNVTATGTQDTLLLGSAGADTLAGDGGSDRLIGGKGNDTLTGGAGQDTLLGGADNDTLHGDDGAGGDILIGGEGFDTYYADDGDTIRDSDGQGTVYLNGKKLTFATRKKGETVYKDPAGNTYILSGTTLQINDPLTIEDFDNGEMGIYLDEEDPAKPPKKPPYDPNNALRISSSPLALDLNDNGYIDDISLAHSNVYFDLTQDGVAEKTGWLAPEDGLLAIDTNGNGVVDDRGELFGDYANRTGFDRLSELIDSNQDGVVNETDPLFNSLRVWQDANSDGISQTGELKTLDELGISAINTAQTRVSQLTPNGNTIIATGSYTRNSRRQYVTDIEFAYDAGLTDANPNYPLGQPPALDSEVFQLPWLRGYGDVKSLHLAYQDDLALRQAAKDLIAQGRDGILQNFEGFMAQWTGLTAAHQARGVTRANISIEDKVWMLETMIGQNVQKGAIEAAAFAMTLNWDTVYIESQWQALVQKEALAFAIQATAKDWIKGANYSLAGDRFVVTDAAMLKDSLVQGISAIGDEQGALFAATLLARLHDDGCDLQAPALKQALGSLPYAQIYVVAIDGRFASLTAAGNFSATDSGDWWIAGSSGNDSLAGFYGQDTLDGGAGNDTLQGYGGNDTYLFNLGDGQDTIYDTDSTTGNVDTIQFGAGIAASDISFTRSNKNLILNIGATGDRITIQGYGDGYRIEQVKFADGNIWDAAYLQTQIVGGQTVGTSGNDTLRAWPDENATLQGMGGDDLLVGNSGNDTYVFNLGDGQDTISDTDATAGNVDILQFGAGITASNIGFTRSGNDLILSVGNTGDRIKIQNWGYGDGYRIEKVKFADGTTWDAAYLQAQVASTSIVGTNGNDSLQAWSGENATLQGMGGNDSLTGNNGNDTLDGGAGNDYLAGAAGNDTYMFNLGDGQDTISDADATTGNVDILQFGVGITASDISFTSNGYALILNVGTAGDRITIQNWGYGDNYRIEQVKFADGTTWDAAFLQGQASTAPFAGTNGNDNLQGDAGNNTLDGGAGNDTLQGNSGNDTYLFNPGGGQDTIYDYDYGAGNLDTIQFGAGIAASDISFTRNGYALILNAGTAGDRISIQNWGYGDNYRIEQVKFADGTAWDAAYLQAQVASTSIVGTNGNDTLRAWSGENANLQGMGGNDYLVGAAGNDTYMFNLGYGQDTIYDYDYGAGNLDTIQFGAGIAASDIGFTRSGNDLILNVGATVDRITIQNWGYGDGYRIEQVKFADGTAWDAAYLQAQIASAPLVGTNGNDTLRAWPGGNATLQGLGGDDILYGNSGSDILEGGTGGDYLAGAAGNDTYLFNLGDEQDTISDADSAAGNQDTLQFGAGIAASDITFTRSGNDLILGISGTGDKIKIANWQFGDAYRIEQVKFSDGTIWDAIYLQTRIESIPIVGTSNSDTLQAWPGENDTLQGMGGNDSLAGNNGNDTLDGGAGNDYLAGEAGSDTYIFNLGGGQDTISDTDATTGNVDTLQFGAGITASDIGFTRSGNDLILSVGTTGDHIKIQNWGYGDSYRIEQVKFADGTAWDAAYLQAQIASAPLVGTNGNDSLYAWSGGNTTLQGLGGDDTLNGGSGNDTLEGGTGRDYLQGKDGNDTYVFNLGDEQDTISDTDSTTGNMDTLQFGAGIAASDITFTRSGSDLILGISGTGDKIKIANWQFGDAYRIEQVKFSDGAIWAAAEIQAKISAIPIVGTSGNDILQGDTGINFLDGGIGNDTLYGGEGNDTYLFNLGDGQDTIYDQDTTAGNLDILQFGAGIAANDISFLRSGNDLVLGINGTGGQITIQDWGYGDRNRIEQVKFADDTIWDAAYLQDKALAIPITGTNGDDMFYAWFGDNSTLQGMGGNDALIGNSGWNILDGGTGNDWLQGNEGNDTYLFNLGDGQDTIYDYAATAGNIDILQFGTGITANDIHLSYGNNGLVLGIGGSNDQITIQNWDNGDDYRIEQVKFADGTIWDTEHLLSQISATPIVGTDGNDGLHGDSGDNFLDGGAGDDFLSGGAGNDTYLFNLGGGQDTIYENDSTPGNRDTLQFGTGIAAEDIIFSLSGNDLVLGIRGTSDQISILNWGSGNSCRIEQVKFADGTIWDEAHLQSQVSVAPILGTNGNDGLQGDAGNNILDGGAGDDVLMGNAGNDTYLFNLGGGQDMIIEFDETAGNLDILRFGTGIAADDIIFSRNGDDLILSIRGTNDQVSIQNWRYGASYQIEQVKFADGTTWDAAYLQAKTGTSVLGTAGDEILQAWADENAILEGMGGNDILNGSNGNDALDGGIGDDALSGSTGSDTYVFNLGYGHDTISEGFKAYPTEGDVDTLQFGAGIAVGDITFVRSGFDLVMNINGTNDQVMILRWGEGGGNLVERVVFADGTVWDAAQLQGQSAGTPVMGTAMDETLQAWANENATLKGMGGNDFLYGNNGNDTLDGGAEEDYLQGGLGNDTYIVDNIGDIVNESTDEGSDMVKSSVSYTLEANVENLALTGAAAINGTGNELNNTLAGNSAANILMGGAGNDIYVFGKGSGQDTVDSYDTTIGKIDTVQFDGTVVSSEVLVSRSGNDLVLTINGTTDTLTIQHYMDNDGASAYAVEQIKFLDGTIWDVAAVKAMVTTNHAPVLSTALPDLAAGQGSAFSYTVSSSAFTDPDAGDTLSYSATLADGSALPSWLGFDATTRTFSGTPDTLGTISVWVTAKDPGNLIASDIFDIAVSVNNLTLNGTSGVDTLNGGAGDDTLNGLAGNDVLNGYAGNDRLDGGTGADKMFGGTGDDTYVVSISTDVITENADEGTDSVESSVTYTLATNIENLTLTGTSAINAIGNTLDNVLKGNSAANTLSGGTGADTLIGGAGNDTYVVDNILDVVTENPDEGADLVQSGVTHTLAANVENLTLTGTTAVNGTGNTLDNALTGNSAVNTLTGGAGNDRLDGKTGADKMFGGTGDDTYVVNVSTDVITENANEGIDSVESSVTYTLAANVENLTLTGTAAINGTGNTLNNVLKGNSAVNSLTGAAGNDTLDGLGGTDTLTGGTGNDTYLMGRGYGVDTVVENDATSGNTDIAQFLRGVTADQIWFQHIGNNLEASIIGTSDKATISNWYSGSQYHIEQFKTADGKVLLDSQVENLVNAMASFAPPSAGQTSLPPAYQTSLNTVIAANWQ